ncbi:tetraspanin-10 [Struthio camelus]|uniref:tetraspanin-10 n=1 Tax=Struthio camelus TaxID=8801 RepID=UPI003603C4EB
MVLSGEWLSRLFGPRGESSRLLPEASRLVELPFSSSDDDDDDEGSLCSPAGEAGRPVPPQPSASGRCVKYLALTWNLLFLLLGLLALAAGLGGLLARGRPVGEGRGPPGSEAAAAAAPLALAGLGASAVSLAGCLGALCASPCLLRFFVGAAGALAGLEVLAGLLVYAARRRLRNALRDALLLCLLRYPQEPDLRVLVDEVQRSLRCCGLGSYRDWESNPYFNCSAPGAQACSVPASCCLDPRHNGSAASAQCALGALRLGEAAARSVVHMGGCVAQLGAWLRGQAGAIAAGTAVLVLVEAAGALMALKMLRDIAPRPARE